MAAEDAYEAEAMMQYNLADRYLKYLSQVASSKPALVAHVEAFNATTMPKLAKGWLGWYDARPLRRAAANLVQQVQPIAAALVLIDCQNAHQDSFEESRDTAPALDTSDTQISRYAQPRQAAHFQQPAIAEGAAVRKEPNVPVKGAADICPTWILTQPCAPVNGFSHVDLFRKPLAHVSGSPSHAPLQAAEGEFTSRLHSTEPVMNRSDLPSTEKHRIGSICSRHSGRDISGLSMHLSPEGHLLHMKGSRPSGSDRPDRHTPLSPRALFPGKHHLSRDPSINKAAVPPQGNCILGGNSVSGPGTSYMPNEDARHQPLAAAVQPADAVRALVLRQQHCQGAPVVNTLNAQPSAATTDSWGGFRNGQIGTIDWQKASKMAPEHGPEGVSRHICQAALETVWTSVHQGQTSVSGKILDIMPLDVMEVPPSFDFSAPLAEITQAIFRQPANSVTVKRKRSVAEEDPQEGTMKRHKAVINIKAFAGAPLDSMEVDISSL